MADVAINDIVGILIRARDGDDVVDEAQKYVESDVSIFLHTVAALNELENANIIELLRKLRIDPDILWTYLGPSGSIADTNLIESSILKRQSQSLNSQTTKILTYDLGRECSEAYAKLAVLPVENAGKLMGIFRLEPFKVLAVLIQRLGAFCHDAHERKSIIDTLRSLDWPEKSYMQALSRQFDSENSNIWQNAAKASAVLVTEGLVSFDSVFAQLNPTTERLEEKQKAWHAELTKESQSSEAGLSALALAAPLPDDDDDEEEGNFDFDEAEDRSGDGAYGDEPRIESKEADPEEMTVEEVSVAPAEIPTSVESTPVPESFLAQKSGESLYEIFIVVLCELCQVDPEIVLPVVLKYPYLVHTIQDVHKGLCKAVERVLRAVVVDPETFYEDDEDYEDITRLSPVNSWKQLEQFASLWLRLCSPYDRGLARTLSNLLRRARELNYTTNRSQEIARKWMNFVQEHCLREIYGTDGSVRMTIRSSLSLQEPLLEGEREPVYEILSAWFYDFSKHDPWAKSSSEKVESQTRSILRRITDTLTSEIDKQLYDLIQADPMTSLSVIMGQAENYDKIAGLLASMQQLPRPLHSAFPLTILDKLSLDRPGWSADGKFPARWLVLLTKSLTGLRLPVPSRSPHKFYPLFDLKTILDYHLGLVSQGRNDYLYMFREILTRMGDVTPLSNLTPTQLERILYQKTVARITVKSLGLAKAGATSVQLLHDALDENAAKWLYHLVKLVLTDFEAASASAKDIQYGEMLETLQLFIEFIHQEPYNAKLEEKLSSVDLANLPAELKFTIQRPFLSHSAESDLYTTFWSLSGYDICFSDAIYDRVLVDVERNDREDRNDRDGEPAAKILAKERLNHKLKHQTTLQQLQNSSKTWFESSSISNFVSECVLCRAVLSPIDGLYTSRFVQLFRTLEVPGASITDVLDLIFDHKLILAVIEGSMSSAINGFAVFVYDTLKNARVAAGSDENELERLGKWHYEIVKALLQAIGDTNVDTGYTQNAIQLISKSLDVFPVLRSHGAVLMSQLEPLTNDTNLPGDVVTAANSLMTRLILKEPTWTDQIEALAQPTTSVSDNQNRATRPTRPSGPAGSYGSRTGSRSNRSRHGYDDVFQEQESHRFGRSSRPRKR